MLFRFGIFRVQYLVLNSRPEVAGVSFEWRGFSPRLLEQKRLRIGRILIFLFLTSLVIVPPNPVSKKIFE
ncbi:hypothetical protein A2W40_03910 [Candidatus Giovannonibacteria bacterium RIFCSPHIGHO2_01_45_12]|nr:MAG: hypothetical protein A2W40_03910 [Candidatus Giovannonibacteria bacterium RIFCSPHIGHO2_01_45_12]